MHKKKTKHKIKAGEPSGLAYESARFVMIVDCFADKVRIVQTNKQCYHISYAE